MVYQRRQRKQCAPARSCPNAELCSALLHLQCPIKKAIPQVGKSNRHEPSPPVAPSTPDLPEEVQAKPFARKKAVTANKLPRTGKKSSAASVKTGLCCFCGQTESPMWRKGPEQYPRLCNACGMRYSRCKDVEAVFTEEGRQAVLLRNSSSQDLKTHHDENLTAEADCGTLYQEEASLQHSRDAMTVDASSECLHDDAPANCGRGKRLRKLTSKAAALQGTQRSRSSSESVELQQPATAPVQVLNDMGEFDQLEDGQPPAKRQKGCVQALDCMAVSVCFSPAAAASSGSGSNLAAASQHPPPLPGVGSQAVAAASGFSGVQSVSAHAPSKCCKHSKSKGAPHPAAKHELLQLVLSMLLEK